MDAPPIILTIDDDEAIRSSFRFYFEDEGYHVVEAKSGLDGLALIEQMQPALVLLDLRMPGQSGMTTLAQIRAINAVLPVIVISGTGGIGEVIEAMRTGAWDYLTKPVSNMTVLRTAVERVLTRARQMQAEQDHRGELEQEIERRTRDLQASEAKYRRIFESLQDVYCEFEPDGTIVEISPSAESMFGYRRSEVVGKSLWYIGVHRREISRLLDALRDKGQIGDHELMLRDRTGHSRPVSITAQMHPDSDDTAVKFSGMLRDISERKRAEAEIAYRAFHDDLTDLPNRVHLIDQLSTLLERSEELGAVLFIDIDHFKTINDSLGHAVGDALLIKVAERLHTCLYDTDTAARVGGDEFVLLLRDLGDDSQSVINAVHIVADQTRTALSKVFNVEGYELYLTPSIGIVLYPADGRNANDLLRCAEIAMVRAKAGGRNSILRYQPEMEIDVKRRLALEQQLREAITAGQLELYFQPLVDAEANLLGGEALLRWHHPQRGLISPSDFIGIAEETGLIVTLGDWVLNETCRQLGLWYQHSNLAELCFAINISPRQFNQPDLVDRIQYQCAKSRIPPNLLKLELTERIMVDNADAAIDKMLGLQRIGVQFSIDDFGTGYSSLGYLKRLPVDSLKIDRSFVRNIDTDASGAVIVETILAMAEHLELNVVAEGVETIEELNFLCSKGCRQFQGYYFGEPVPAAEFYHLLPPLPPQGSAAANSV